MTQTAAHVFQQQWHYTSVSDGTFSVHRGPDGSGPDPVAHDIQTVEDARLIAAAPEMAHGLAFAESWINEECERRGGEDDEYESPAFEAVNRLRAVLAKAKGEAAPAARQERHPSDQIVVALLDDQAAYLLRLLAAQTDETALVIADQIEQSCDDDREPVTVGQPLDAMSASVRRAAPQLLAALEGLLPEIEQEIEQRQPSGDDEYWLGLDRLAADARDAIAKAKGLQDTQAGNPTPN